MSSFYDKPSCKTQKQHWEYLQSKKSSHFRGSLTRRFNVIFPRGHRTSIRPIVRAYARYICKGKTFPENSIHKLMGDIHPEAFEILLTYGKDYIPHLWGKAPPSLRPDRCYANSWVLAQVHEQLIYVEGIVVGVVIKPMLHAWNAVGLEGRAAMDFTQYSVSRWSRYLGIPFSLEEHAELCRLNGLPDSMAPLFHKRYFTAQAKARLISILEKRS